MDIDIFLSLSNLNTNNDVPIKNIKGPDLEPIRINMIKENTNIIIFNFENWQIQANDKNAT